MLHFSLLMFHYDFLFSLNTYQAYLRVLEHLLQAILHLFEFA